MVGSLVLITARALSGTTSSRSQWADRVQGTASDVNRIRRHVTPSESDLWTGKTLDLFPWSRNDFLASHTYPVVALRTDIRTPPCALPRRLFFLPDAALLRDLRKHQPCISKFEGISLIDKRAFVLDHMHISPSCGQ